MVAASTGQWHLITSSAGRDGSIAIHQDAELSLARLAPGQELSHQPRQGRHVWLHVAEGQVDVNGKLLKSGDAVAADDKELLSLKAMEPTQVLLFDMN